MKVTRLVSPTALHLQYPGQNARQPCHVILDARDGGTLTAEADPEIGGSYPEAVGLGHVLRFTVGALRTGAANALLEEIAPLAERVVRGYQTAWDGNDTIAVYSEDAQQAEDEIQSLCDATGSNDAAELTVWTASEWFAPWGTGESICRELGITPETTDDELKAIAARERESAKPEVDGIEELEEYLRGLRTSASAKIAA